MFREPRSLLHGHRQKPKLNRKTANKLDFGQGRVPVLLHTRACTTGRSRNAAILPRHPNFCNNSCGYLGPFFCATFTRITLPACRAHYPGGSNGCLCRLLRRSLGLPRVLSGSASALWISRPAQASLALRPAGSLDRQKRPLSRGFGPSSCPSKPLVSYQINRQLSGRNPPPLVTRAFGAHQNEPNDAT